LVTYKDRFSRKNLFAIFVACAFAIHIWSIFGLLNQIPAWILRVNLWELAGMVSLTLVFTLFESLIVTLGVVLLVALIPGEWFTKRVVTIAAVFIWLTAILSIIAHLQEPLIRSFWGPVILITYLVLLVGSVWMVWKFPKFEMGLQSLLGRLTVLTAIYLFIDLIALVIVVIRNI
jgi:hypothetical protein